jgi:hypothetical protein
MVGVERAQVMGKGWVRGILPVKEMGKGMGWGVGLGMVMMVG